ncbi:right-handed parallel beta-helix repeat-containing protein [Myxococcus sp. K38C18041901]|uniref:right-handed parallel beta-helix repeat-containing protein n=1 Tax=Myxococcus guangdongensis TaxID=2906760 RepID=UPI0020A72D7E|nr:right-handed parallel beta-helix repeat-containing protein [Myxococcus guangdongensis]MCP3062429.1 right-handed parallel beta-helix repeat-containing protein [Myxococcus guangdongensis]
MGSRGKQWRAHRLAVLVAGLALACAPGVEGSEHAEASTRQGVLRAASTSTPGGDEDAKPLEAPSAFRDACPGSEMARGPTLHVASTGPRDDDEPLGSRGNPYTTIMAAVREARPGNIIQVHAGIYPEQVAITPLKARAGTASAPIVLRGDRVARPLIVPTSADVGSLMMLSQPYWVVEFVEVDVRERPSFAALFENEATCSQLRDSVLHGGRAGGGVVVSDASRLLISGNKVHDFSRWGQDSHAVVVKGTSREVFIVGNDLHDVSGDAVQCQPNGGRPSKLVIEGNQMHDCGENGIDVKACDDLAIQGNLLFRFPNLERYPWQATTSAAEAVLVHEDATNIRIIGNIIFQAGRGISIGGLSPVDNPTDVLLMANIVTDIFNFANRANGQGIRVARAHKVRVLDNIIERTEDSGLRLAADEPLIVTDLQVYGNTLRDMASFVKLGRDTSRPGLRMDHNRYEGADGKFSAFGLLSIGTFTTWQSRLAPFNLEQGSLRITAEPEPDTGGLPPMLEEE